MNDQPTYYPNLKQSIGLFLYMTISMFIVAIPLVIIAGPTHHYKYYKELILAISYGAAFLITINVAVKRMKMSNTPLPVFEFKHIKADVVFMGVIISLGTTILVEFLQILIPLPQSHTLHNGAIGLFLLSVAAPVLEETLFRGIILKGLLQHYKPATAIAVSALLFALGHFYPWHIVATFIAGSLMGWIYYKTRSLVTTMLIHCIYNCMAFLSGLYPAYDLIYKMPYAIGTLILLAVILFVALRYLNGRLNRGQHQNIY